MTRYSVTHPDPEELADLSRYPAPVIEKRYRLDVALTVLSVLIVLTFGAWMVWPVIEAGLGRSNDWPSACSTLTASDCAARMSEAR